QLGDEWAVNEAVDFAPAFELESDLPEVKLFGKWNLQEVNVADISLVDYITIKEKYAKYLPHSAGRYQNPVQVLVNAVIMSLLVLDAPVPSVVSPSTWLPSDAMWLLGAGAHEAAFRNIKTIAECVADELINAAKESPNNYAIKKKDEPERVAQFNV
ncbi:hypothetical protein PRIPAC_95306, partial [Pristionchus pacificus]|uniref:Ribosomal protein n=1 Tax=Pristionchus pacificus TaxID=54126 RepID=A0A2A6BJK9_PRIPA